MTRAKTKKLLLIIAIALSLKNTRKRRYQVHPIFNARKTHGEYFTLKERLDMYPMKFFEYFRMSREQFQTIFFKIRPDIQPTFNLFRKDCISAKEKFVLTLRFLATGASFADLSFRFLMGKTTVGACIIQTIRAINKHFLDVVMPIPESPSFWREVSHNFLLNWNFPNCLGAVDGKHVKMFAPRKSGSLNYNYKKCFSTVLMAVVDANYKFLMVSIGAHGSNADPTVFSSSNFGKAWLNNPRSLFVPGDQKLPNTENKQPFVLIGDEAFGLRYNLMTPFPGSHLTNKQRVFNYRVVERELSVPLPLSKIIKKWNNLLQEYKAIKISEDPKRREWPFFALMDVYFSDQVNDPSLRLFSSTKTLKESLDDSVFEDDPIIVSAIAAVTSGACMEKEELLKKKKLEGNENNIPKNGLSSENNITSTLFLSASASPCTKTLNSHTTSLRISGNKSKVVTVKHLNFKQQQLENESISENISEKDGHVKSQNYSTDTSSSENKFGDSIDQYLLSWNNFLGNMSRGFHSLQKNEKMVDVTIAAGGRIFKAHKLVLSVCSPYFQEIFLDNPSNHPILLMADVDANHMAGLLNFMYSGQVNVKYEDLPVFLKVAEAMKIKGLHTEKPTSSNLEIQFSHDDNPSKQETLNFTAKTVDLSDQVIPKSFKSQKGREYQYLHQINKTIDSSNCKQTSNKLTILKTNNKNNFSEHLKQEKLLTKRKIFVHTENEFKDKMSFESAERDLATNHARVSRLELQGDNCNEEEILNLTQNKIIRERKRNEPAFHQAYSNTNANSNVPNINDVVVNRSGMKVDDRNIYINTNYNSNIGDSAGLYECYENSNITSETDNKMIQKHQADTNNNVCLSANDVDGEIQISEKDEKSYKNNC